LQIYADRFSGHYGVWEFYPNHNRASPGVHLTDADWEESQPMNLTKEDLEKLLREAEKAHGAYEQKLGHRDDNWPSWYAEFIVKKLRGSEKAA
jgi:hypothetical protein